MFLTEVKSRDSPYGEQRPIGFSLLDVKFRYWCLIPNLSLVPKRPRSGHLAQGIGVKRLVVESYPMHVEIKNSPFYAASEGFEEEGFFGWWHSVELLKRPPA